MRPKFENMISYANTFLSLNSSPNVKIFTLLKNLDLLTLLITNGSETILFISSRIYILCDNLIDYLKKFTFLIKFLVKKIKI